MESVRAQGIVLTAAVALLLSACANPAGVPYDCTVQAVRAQAELPPGRWSRLLMAQYHDVAMGHTYMVFDSLDGHLFAYDSVFGSRPIFPRSREAKDVAAVVDPRAETAWFVEDTAKRKPFGTVAGQQQPAGPRLRSAKRKPALSAGKPPAMPAR